MHEIKSSTNFGFYITATSFIALIVSTSTFFSFSVCLEALEIIFIFTLILFVVVTLIRALMGRSGSSWCVNGLSYYNFLGAQKYVPIEQIRQIKVRTIIYCKVTHVKLEQKNIFLFSCNLTTQQIKSLINFGFYIIAASVISLIMSISMFFSFTVCLEILEKMFIFTLILFVVVTLIRALMGKSGSSWCVNGLSYYNFLGAQKYVPIEQIRQIKVRTIIYCKVTHVKLEQKNIFLFNCNLTTQQKNLLAQLGYFEN